MPPNIMFALHPISAGLQLHFFSQATPSKRQYICSRLPWLGSFYYYYFFTWDRIIFLLAICVENGHITHGQRKCRTAMQQGCKQENCHCEQDIPSNKLQMTNMRAVQNFTFGFSCNNRIKLFNMKSFHNTA